MRGHKVSDMTGWLVVNSFLDTRKYYDLYDLFKNAAKVCDIDLVMKTGADLLCDVESDFRGYGLPDFVLFFDKDIYLAKRLEQAGIRLFNQASAVELCDNKILTALGLKGRVSIPKTVIAPKTFEHINYCKKDFVSDAAEELGFPMIIKEAYGSFGQQVYLVKDYEQAVHVIDSFGSKDFLMQEFIEESVGKDIRINVVGGRVVSAILRYNNSDFRSNISNGGSMKAYEPSKEQKEMAVEACAALGLDFAGVDVLLGKDGEPVICEVNSNPHFKSTLECTGCDMSMDIMNYIKSVLL